MATPESRVKDKIKAEFKRVRAYYTMPVMTGMATNGTLDFSACHAYQAIFVEAKAGKNVLSALQKARAAEARASGGLVLVINETNVGLLRDVLDALSAGEYTQARLMSNLDDWL